MPITPELLAAARPYAYHVCGSVNFESIRASRALMSAKVLLSGTPHENLLSDRRKEPVQVSVNGQTIEIRDHRPLVLGSLNLPLGYALDEFIAELNSRVFLWAGTLKHPVPSGRNHIRRYSSLGPVYILRVPLRDLMAANPESMLQVTFCNSGAARHNRGRPARRGPGTFVSLTAATRPIAGVVEITYRGQAKLPDTTAYAANLTGPWFPFLT